MVAISYKIKFIDTARSMGTSLSYIVDNRKKEFTKLNAKIVIFFFKMKVLKKIQSNINVHLAIKIIQT